MSFDDFLTHWLTESPLAPPPAPHERVAGNVGVTLYRITPFQVQLWICQPDTDIGDHSHPGVDGWALRVAGDIRFRKNGQPVGIHDMKIVSWRGMKTPMVRVAPGESHGVRIGPVGGSFLAITHWLESEPRSVHLSWAGEALDAVHRQQLGVK